MSKEIYELILLACVAFCCNGCGKAIRKAEWEKAVSFFLFALGGILLMVRETPPWP